MEDLPLIRQETDTDSVDFFIAKMGFIASGDNRQDCYISEETLREYAPTIRGKFVTAKYDWWTDDVMSHEKDLDIIGYVPFDAEITYERTEDGRLMAYCDAVLSKIYCFDVYKLFRKDNYRAVSAEFSCMMRDENSDTGEIVSMQFHSITILGKEVSPAIPDANIKIVKFSEDEANTFYEEQNSINSLKKFTENRKKMLENKESEKSSEEENMKKEFEDKKEPNTEDVVMDEKKELSAGEKEKEFESDEDKKDEKKFEDTQEKADKKQDEEDEKEEDEIEKKEFAKEEDKEDDKKFEDKEKTFSLEAYVDATATLAMLEKETAERKTLAEKVLKEMGADKLFATVMELSKENEELKKYKADREETEKERKFSSIMAEVKGDIPDEEYKKLYNEGKTLKFSDMENFEIKVQAFAYKSSKNSNGDFRIPPAETNNPNTSHKTVEDIYKEYL